MDGERFDALLRGLGRARNRRAIFGLLGGALAGAVAGRAGGEALAGPGAETACPPASKKRKKMVKKSVKSVKKHCQRLYQDTPCTAEGTRCAQLALECNVFGMMPSTICFWSWSLSYPKAPDPPCSTSGACQDPARMCCAGSCILADQLDYDVNNCGACGHQCGANQWCDNGICDAMPDH